MRILFALLAILSMSYASVVGEYLNNLKDQAKIENPNFKEFNIQRGKNIFTSKHIGKKGKEISCTSCHGNDLQKAGKNLFTAKVIEPLSPKTNPTRFTEVETIEKWLRRNFKDVYNREGTLQEKGDVVTYIINQ